MRKLSNWVALGLPLLAACSAPAAPPAATPAPDVGKRLVAGRAMVSSAHPRASEAGVEMMRRGGNAVDAAVATAFAVSVGEPQMSGLGGGGGMLIWLQDQRRAEYLDFYSAQRPETFRGLRRDDAPRTELRTVGIPGEVAGLLAAHERFGKLPRAEVMAPAIRLAEEGFPVNQILASMIAGDSAKLARYPESFRVFWPNGKPLQPGEILRQPDLAATLRRVAEQGRSGFYEGEVAQALVRELNAGGHPATLADLAAMQPQWKRPMCGEYRGHVVLSAAPPQTGLQIVHTLALLEPYDLRSMGLPTRSARAFDVLTSALRTGMTSSRYNGDPNWTDSRAAGVVAPAYVASRRALVGTGRAVERVDTASPAPFVGVPPSPKCMALRPFGSTPTVARAATTYAPVAEVGPAGGETTHLSVVDPDGNAVALTHTNSSVFGVGDRVAGFFLNDSGIDFSRDSTGAGAMATGRHAWRVRGSTISPTIVLRDGRAVMVVGAPGGGRIPTEILQNMVYVLDYGLDPLEALRLPRIYPSSTSTAVQLENGFAPEVLHEIRQMGYRPSAESFGYARLYMIARRGDRWVGAADPRHNGEVRGF